MTTNDTIDGGNGTDSLQFGSSTAGAAAIDLTTVGLLTGITSIEKLVLADTDTDQTLTVDDKAVGLASNALLISVTQDGNGTQTVVNNTLSSTATVTTTMDVAGILAYTVGNSIDKVTGNSSADVITVSSTPYLAGTDIIAGGSGGDTLKFTSTTASQVVTAAQLAGISSVETISVETTSTNQFTITLSDAVASSNTSGTSFTVTRGSDTSTGALKADGSAVTTYALTLTGDAGADTLIGGGGADTISGGAADSANDSLTGGTGNDDFILDNGAGIDTITDINFGTSSTNIDRLNVAAVNADGTAVFDTTVDTITLSTVGIADLVVATDVFVVQTNTYANAAALDTYIETAAANTITLDVTVVYADSFGNVRVAVIESDGSETGAGADFTTTDVAILSNVTLTGIASLLSTGDFVTA